MGFPHGTRNGQDAFPSRRWSIRHYLIGLVTACLLPGIVGTGFLFFQEYREGRDRLERDNIQTARALAQTVDAYLLRAQAVALTLSTDDSLARRDLRRFHRRAREVLSLAGLGNNFVLTDMAGQQVINTLRDFGEPLPRHANPEVAHRVLSTGKPVISDLFIGGVLRGPIMSIDVPVVLDGKVAYVLSIGILPGQFSAILNSQRLPPNWVTAIFDTTGTIVARSHSPDKFVGQKGTGEFVRRIRETGEGSMETVTREGIPTLSMYSRAPATRWSVAIGIPRKELTADLAQTLLLLAAGIASVFGIGFGLAWAMGGRISGSVRTINELALVLGKGQRPPPQSFGVREVDEAARAIGQAAELLEQRAAALERSEGNLRQLIATLPGMVWTTTPDGSVDFVSQQWLDYTGKTPESLFGAGFLEVIHPDDRKKTGKLWQEALTSMTFYNAEYRLRRHDGSYCWFKSRGAPVLDRDGKILRWLGVVLEIDDLKQADAALRLSETRFRRLFEVKLVGILIADARGEVIEANDYFLNLIGYSREELERGMIDWRALTPPEWLPADERAIAELAETGMCTPFEKEYLRRDGSRRSIFLMGATLPGDDGQILTLTLDITDRRQAEKEIERLNADLELRVKQRTAELLAANQELEGFTFATSHDLRGPLGRINNFSTLLENKYRDRLEGDGLLFLDFIRQNATRLVHLVDDLLSHARVARHALELQSVDVPALVRAVVQDRADDLRDSGAEIRVNLLPGTVLGDSHALNQVLANLLENAIKYSGKVASPVIEIGGEIIGERYRLWVRDNGIGFDMAYHDRIFEMFRRLHTYNDYQGSGVGLALVKRAMERMEGKVWAESRPGQGATFFLELQAANLLLR